MPMKKVTPSEMTKLAFKIMEYLAKHDLWDYVIIYANGKRYLTPDYRQSKNAVVKKHKNIEYVEESVNVQDYVKYSNPQTITIAFENTLYDIINDNIDYVSKFDKLFLDEYGLYFELGESWNMSAYNI